MPPQEQPPDATYQVGLALFNEIRTLRNAAAQRWAHGDRSAGALADALSRLMGEVQERYGLQFDPHELLSH